MLLLAATIAAFWTTSAHGQEPEPIRRRGRFLRSEIVRTEKQPSFTCSLAQTAQPYPVLRFRRLERVTHYEVSIYEVLIPDAPEAERSDFQAMAYRIVPGEEMRGETKTRSSTRDAGPFADATFSIDDIVVTTDEKGLYIDREQVFLKPFDDLGVNTWDTTVRHEELGVIPLTLSRYLTRRWADDENAARIRLSQTDILVALGLHYEPLSPADRGGIALRVNAPASARPGEAVVITVSATNSGNRTVSCLLGRMFSRHDWLSRTNLYIGNLAPGETKSFERRLRAPDTLPPGQPLYASVGFWDILGPLKGSAKRIRILPETPTP